MIRTAIVVLVLALTAESADAGLQIDFDYSYDSTGFFDEPQRRDALEAAGRVVNRYVDELDAIIPAGDNGWTSYFTRPDTGVSFFLSDLPVPQDTMQVFVSGRSLPGFLAISADMGPTGLGDPDWVDTVTYRGQSGAGETPPTDVGPTFGRMVFNNDLVEVPWHFETTTDGLEPEEFDFVTVAMHELIHLLGIGVSPSFKTYTEGGRFVGPNAIKVGSRTNPDLELDPQDHHLRSDTTSPWNGQLQEALLAPAIFAGERAFPTSLDRAILTDIGWTEAIAGDANRDGLFDSSDFVEVFQSGKYETSELAGWADGDWNDNGLFESGDLVAALQTGTYEQGPAAIGVVPEPSGAVLAFIAGLGLLASRNRTNREPRLSP